jgi:hypothetical protein
MRLLEATVGTRRLARSRLVWAVAMAGLGALLAAVSAWGGDREGISAVGAALNALCFIGLGLTTAALLGADLAWLGPSLLALGTFFFGKDFDNQNRSWAWLLHPPSDPGSWSISIGLLLAGIAMYSALDSIGLLPVGKAHS